MTDTVLMSAADIGKTLRRLSYQLLEAHDNTSSLLLIGIRTRGVPLAQRIAHNVSSDGNPPIPVAYLDARPYRDDRGAPSQPTNGSATPTIPGGVTGKDVILVDDVLFTGRTVRAAMDALIDLGRPHSIKLLVLVDRGHRELPIRADFVGKNIPTSLHQTIKVRLRELDPRDEVVLLGNPASTRSAHRIAGGVEWG